MPGYHLAVAEVAVDHPAGEAAVAVLHLAVVVVAEVRQHPPVRLAAVAEAAADRQNWPEVVAAVVAVPRRPVAVAAASVGWTAAAELRGCAFDTRPCRTAPSTQAQQVLLMNLLIWEDNHYYYN